MRWLSWARFHCWVGAQRQVMSHRLVRGRVWGWLRWLCLLRLWLWHLLELVEAPSSHRRAMPQTAMSRQMMTCPVRCRSGLHCFGLHWLVLVRALLFLLVLACRVLAHQVMVCGVMCWLR